MSPQRRCIVIVLLTVGVIHASPKLNDVRIKTQNCENSPQGHVFDEAQAIGTWHAQRHKSDKPYFFRDSECAQLTSVNEQERNEVKKKIGNYTANLKWENLTLRMQIPCQSTSMRHNVTEDHYLERLDGHGIYRTLHVPLPSAKLELGALRSIAIRLKIIENEYLGLMGCHVFFLSKKPFDDTDIEERLNNTYKYWPKDLS
ncbi:uncharacterized protein LOC114242965 [Bombyx mandarina]|uniref:Uncharacterized protein n=2 Tax=Bombyx TaxID=7090 RepID=A0A8R2AUM5_BOMMO|nr:uncharacterized protein LOC101735473 [Bombyx mori]XP_028030111.1 uncharacterized protein LOC114242965 [Bombyx mandarina]